MPDEFSWPDGSGTAWNIRYSLQFHRQLESRYFRPGKGRDDVPQKINSLLADPQGALRAERLREELSGLRSARLNRRDRFIYKLCAECRQFGDQNRWPIGCCLGQTADTSMLNMLFISLSHYSDIPKSFDLES